MSGASPLQLLSVSRTFFFLNFRAHVFHALFFAFLAYARGKIRGHRMTEVNEVHVSQPELMGSVRDTIARSTLDELYKSKKAAGQMSWSVRVKPVCAKDRAMIAQAYNSAVVHEKMPAEDSDRALIAEAYKYLQESGQLPVDQHVEQVVVCVHSSDEVLDFFAGHGLGACADKLCEHLGIENAEDLKLITAQDLQGSKFSAWAHGSLTLVQYKKVLKAFS